MMTKTPKAETTTVATPIAPALLLAFELGDRTWKLGFTIGFGQSARLCSVPARATDRVLEEIARAKARFHFPADVSVTSCYEAGREGFWLHRWLLAQQVSNHVIDSSSIEVNRRARRAKTDRLDLSGLLTLLARHVHGDRRVWRVVRAPSVAEEDARHLHRTRETIQQDRTRLINRLKSLLLTQGLALAVDASFPTALTRAQLWDGTPIPAGLKARLDRAWAHLTFLNDELEQLDAERDAVSVDPETPLGRYIHALPTLRGNWSGRRVDIGHGTVWLAAGPESAPTGRLSGTGAGAVSER
jgi:transposase